MLRGIGPFFYIGLMGLIVTVKLANERVKAGYDYVLCLIDMGLKILGILKCRAIKHK